MAGDQNDSNEEYQEPTRPPTSSGIQMEEFQIKPIKRRRESSYFFFYSLLLLLLIVISILLAGFYILSKSLKDIVKDTSDLKENNEIAHKKLLNILCKKTAPYHVFTNPETWVQALIKCKSAGMELVSFQTSTDRDNLEKFMVQNEYNESYWTSGTNLGNGTYYWATTCNPIIYSKWLQNQLDNANSGENCIHIYISPKPGWNDVACSYKFPYICRGPETCE